MIFLNKFLLIVTVLVSYYFISDFFIKTKIPDESIRIRILANSNSSKDQSVKEKVKTNLEEYLYNTLKDTKGIDNARTIINNNLGNISNNVKNSLNSLNYNKKYDINFGYNYFPKKEYNGIMYDEGYYESLLVTLGDGLGDNWWCVLFPPLCMLENDTDEVEYKLFVSEILKKYL